MSQPAPQILRNAAETTSAGRKLAAQLEAGSVIALVGDLGAGKTTFTQGLIAALDETTEVTSPTFSLVQEYHGGRVPVFHFDFYRVEEEHELLDLGWDDYLERDGIVIVEWPTLFPELLPEATRWLKLSHCPQGRLLEEISAMKTY